MSEGSERLRLFLAVSVPDAVLRALDRVLEPERERLSAARWAALENQHITLKFLGGVETERVPGLTAEFRGLAADHAPARIAVRGLGAFPGPRKARVLWAGLEDPEGLLSSLADAIDERVGPLGFPPEKRRFTPHLTVARLKAPRSVQEVLDRVSFDSEFFDVGSFCLFRSHLSPRGARYEILDSYVLGSDAPH